MFAKEKLEKVTNLESSSAPTQSVPEDDLSAFKSYISVLAQQTSTKEITDEILNEILHSARLKETFEKDEDQDDEFNTEEDEDSENEQLLDEYWMIDEKYTALKEEIIDYHKERGSFDRVFTGDEDYDGPSLSVNQAWYDEALNEYENSIKELQDLEEQEAILESMNKEIEEITKIQEEIKESYEKRVMQEGIGLICLKTEQPLSEKVLMKLLKQQQASMDELIEVIVNSEQTAQKIVELEEELKTIDDIGDGRRITDFDELCATNNVLAEKIEEKNEKIAFCRARGEKSTQYLAHMREKLKALQAEESEKKLQNSYLEEDIYSLRKEAVKLKSKLNSMQQQKRKQQSGTLQNKPHLLEHFEKSKKEIEKLEAENQELIRIKYPNNKIPLKLAKLLL